VHFIPTRRLWECKNKHAKKQFSVKVGTVLEDSPIGLDKWLATFWLIANCKNGVSSYEVHRDIGVTQKTAWFMLQRIRLAFQASSLEKFSGEVEVDETYIGGKARNMHVGKRREKITGTGGMGKVAVMGLLERHGEVRTRVVPNVRKCKLHSEVKEHVEAGSHCSRMPSSPMTDLGPSTSTTSLTMPKRMRVATFHTNVMENFWSLVKRGITGTYVCVEPFHLFRYLDEQAFRYKQAQIDGCRAVLNRTESDRRQARNLRPTDWQDSGGRNAP
jgi:hypothetical protein